MSKLSTAIRLLKSPREMLLPLADNGLFNWVPDKQYLEIVYYWQMGKRLDLKNPCTFNEKMQWLKLFNRNPLYTTMVDKDAVKGYVASIIGKEYIVPTIGKWSNANDISIDTLPNQFVLKCTHDSGSIIVCKDKNEFNLEDAKKKLHKHLKKNTFWFGREWPYKTANPQIIAEPYLQDRATNELRDYKFFCFGGTVKCFKVDFDRFTCHRANYYDGKRLLRIGECACPPDFGRVISLPKNLLKMEQLAEELAGSLPFVRVDFYNVDGHIYFSELTFYPNSGFGKFIFEGNDELLGSWIDLPI